MLCTVIQQQKSALFEGIEYKKSLQKVELKTDKPIIDLFVLIPSSVANYEKYGRQNGYQRDSFQSVEPSDLIGLQNSNRDDERSQDPNEKLRLQAKRIRISCQ